MWFESLLIFCLLFPQHRNLINAMEKTSWNESTEEEVLKIAESAGDTKKQFNIVNSLCKVDDRYDALPTHDSPRSLANDFGAFFIKKIELIQQDIDKIVVNQPEVQVQPPHARFERFSKLTEDNVQHIIMSSSNATCVLDPIPTWLLKSCSDILMPVITQMLNLSLLEGHVPISWKNAVHSETNA